MNITDVTKTKIFFLIILHLQSYIVFADGFTLPEDGLPQPKHVND
jgi:hypothetical protein